MNVSARIILNDEGDSRCDVCGLGDWYRAVEFLRSGEAPERFVMCSHKYKGPSCLELAVAEEVADGK